MLRSHLALTLLVLPLTAQADPLRPTGLEFVARIGTGEIGREKVELRPDGWTANGAFDVLGTQKGRYSAKLERSAEGFRYRITSDASGEERTIVCTLAGSEFTVEVEGTSRQRRIEVKGEGQPFVFDNLLWACTVDLGRILAARDAAGSLEPGAKLPGLTGAGAAEFAAEHLETRQSEQVVGGQRVALRVFRFRLPPGVEVTMVCTPDGLPLRVEIPSQQLTVEVTGFETVRGVRGEPTSVVDAGPWRQKLSLPTHQVVVERGVKVAMRDGVELVADVYRPAGDGRFPTMLGRTPYRRTTEGGLKGDYFARRGYVFVAQDVRGRFDSGGEWFPFVHEADDGSDTIDWIAAQPWSDGKVGMIGASYVGLVQWLAAKSGNEHLRCIVPQVSPPDPHENFPYEGGAFLLGAAWWARVLESMKLGSSWAQGIDWAKAYATLPLGDLDRALLLQEETFLDTWLAHPPHDREFWAPASYQDAFGEMTVPAFHVSGWYDGDLPGAIQNFPGMRQRARTERARRGQYLVMGPWTHFFNTTRRIGDVDFGDEAVVDLDARVLRFLDRYLKDIDNGIDAEPPVCVFTMGSDRWHAERDWPLPETRFTKLYLGSDGDAARRDGDGRLGLEVSGSAEADSYRYDPNDLPELDIDFTDLSGSQATADQADEPDRADDLEYTSPPLAQPCEIVGPVSATLWVETDAEDTDFAVAVFRLTADGKRFAFRGGVQRLRYAEDPRQDRPVPPGTVTRIVVDCWATGIRLQKGDRLQVVVTSWVWPGYARNLNTLEPWTTATEAVVATNRVYHTAARPSHLLLPIVPRADAPGLKFVER